MIFFIIRLDVKYITLEILILELIDEINKVTLDHRHLTVEILMKHANPRELIDSIYIPFTSTYLCLLILYIVSIVCLINDSYSPLYLGCVACGLVIYFTFLIYSE